MYIYLAEYFSSLLFDGGGGRIIYHTLYGDLHYIITICLQYMYQEATTVNICIFAKLAFLLSLCTWVLNNFLAII